METCPLTGHNIKLQMPDPSRMEFYYETPMTGIVKFTDVALAEAAGLTDEEKRILTGICRNKTVKGEEPITITSSFLKQLKNQNIPYSFEERARHLLRFLYDNGGNEYRSHNMNSANHSPIIYSSADEFERIIKYLKAEEWIDFSKQIKTQTCVFYQGLQITKKGIKEIEKEQSKLPIIEITETEKLWLQEVYDILMTDQRPNEKKIFSRLYGKIPKGFSHNSIDDRLVDSTGEIISILGIIALQRNYSIVEKANKLILKIKDHLISNPEKIDIPIIDIANQCNILSKEAGIILYLASFYGNFFQGYSASVNNGISITSIHLGYDAKYFKQYYYFNDFETLIVLYLDKYKKNKHNFLESQEKMRTNYIIDVFISHSNQDGDVAKSAIELIRSALNISANKIRCTSVHGYKLPIGASTDDQLKSDIFGSKAFIGIISPTSIQSTYVLFELGARWGAGLSLFPIITSKLGVELLKGPLKNINALNCCIEEDVFQFITDLGKELGIVPEAPSVYKEKVTELVRLCLKENLPNESTRLLGQEKSKILSGIPGDDVSEKIIKEQAKKEWPDDYSMQVHYIEKQKNAVEKLKNGRPSDINDSDFLKIKQKAQLEWPLDFEMQVHSEEQQIEAIRKLRTM